MSVEDMSAATLIPTIKEYILPGTKIMSDCLKSYDKLREEGSFMVLSITVLSLSIVKLATTPKLLKVLGGL